MQETPIPPEERDAGQHLLMTVTWKGRPGYASHSGCERQAENLEFKDLVHF